jgi:hypothetical protein
MHPFDFFLICLAICLLVLCIFIQFTRWIRLKRLQEIEYERKYLKIQNYIWELEITIPNYERIKRMFSCMNKLPHKNREKSSVLFVGFLTKFEKVVRELQSEDEFSANEIFKNN